ncbi:MAG: CotH kinase family protein, partial [Bacteroidota bacterium]
MKNSILTAGILLILTIRIFAQNNVPPSDEEALPSIEFSLEGGFYEVPLSVELYAPGAKIYYTLDGRLPSKYTNRYRGAITIEDTKVLRAIAYEGDQVSPVFSQTYFIDEPATDLAVVSISVSPRLLFDPAKGLFVQGNNAIDTLWKKPGANFWSRRELAANIELFESDGRCVYRNLSGFRLFGGMSRLFPQKSMAIVARKRYGKKRFDHPIFGEQGLKKFKFLVLRNSGSDFGKSHFRDAMMTALVDDWDMEKQDFRPAHVYINGNYWGLFHIREKVNRYFIAGHQEVDKDSLDLLEHQYVRKRGSKRHYLRLMDYLEQHDLSKPEHYAYVESQMDIDNFMNYQIAQIYFDNRDAGGNIKYWRPQTPNGRWRWILYDTDWGFGLHDPKAYRHNALAFHTKPNGPVWPNPPWSTFILRKLLENPTFRQTFVNRFADHLNVSFSEARVMN